MNWFVVPTHYVSLLFSGISSSVRHDSSSNDTLRHFVPAARYVSRTRFAFATVSVFQGSCLPLALMWWTLLWMPTHSHCIPRSCQPLLIYSISESRTYSYNEKTSGRLICNRRSLSGLAQCLYDKGWPLFCHVIPLIVAVFLRCKIRLALRTIQSAKCNHGILPVSFRAKWRRLVVSTIFRTFSIPSICLRVVMPTRCFWSGGLNGYVFAWLYISGSIFPSLVYSIQQCFAISNAWSLLAAMPLISLGNPFPSQNRLMSISPFSFGLK